MTLTPEDWLERQENLRALAEAMDPMFEILKMVRVGFMEKAGVGDETADLLAAQWYSTSVAPLVAPDPPAAPALRVAAELALETLSQIDLSRFPPVEPVKLRAAVVALEEALA